MNADHIDSSDVSVSVSSGKVTLEGTVPERYMKHAIEDLVDACPGVQDIDNRIRVETQRDWGQSSENRSRAEGGSSTASSMSAGSTSSGSPTTTGTSGTTGTGGTAGTSGATGTGSAGTTRRRDS
jgi:hypothetical protein